MEVASTASFVEELRKARVLQTQQLTEVAGSLQARCAEPRALARELLQRGWVTAYQVNQLLQGKGDALVLGSYVILERLGEGAMGQVFKARHQTMGRIVALKVIRKDRIAHPTAIRRFQREIRALSKMSHPNVVASYDADEVNGTHFYAMEYVEGTDLAKLVKQSGPLPIVKACDYIRQAALCLQHAHERGLVHRDIKPSNLLLASNGTLVKVLDMGLARIQEAEGEASCLTQEGFVVGTPDFIAPEQARNSHTADIRADLYSLGCSFYFLLTGKVPFQSSNLTQKLLMHQIEPVPRVEVARPEAPAAVSVVIRRLMAKKVEDRYQTPGELARDLTSILKTGGLPPSPGATQLASKGPASGVLVKKGTVVGKFPAALVAAVSADAAVPVASANLAPVAVASPTPDLEANQGLVSLLGTGNRRILILAAVGGVLFLLLVLLLRWLVF